jgi:hypothetical protein
MKRTNSINWMEAYDKLHDTIHDPTLTMEEKYDLIFEDLFGVLSNHRFWDSAGYYDPDMNYDDDYLAVLSACNRIVDRVRVDAERGKNYDN